MLTAFRATLVRVPLLHLAFSLLLFTAVFAAVDVVTGLGLNPLMGPLVGDLAFDSSRRRMRRVRAGGLRRGQVVGASGGVGRCFR